MLFFSPPSLVLTHTSLSIISLVVRTIAVGKTRICATGDGGIFILFWSLASSSSQPHRVRSGRKPITRVANSAKFKIFYSQRFLAMALGDDGDPIRPRPTDFRNMGDRSGRLGGFFCFDCINTVCTIKVYCPSASGEASPTI